MPKLSFHLEPNWHEHIENNLHEMLSNLGQDILEDAQRAVPVDSGDLRDSLDYEVEGDTLHVFATEDYASYVELGTAHQTAQPYLRPSVYKQRGVGAL